MSFYVIDDLGADQPEPASEAFIVKVWVEETAVETGQITWRGYITRVGSDERRYIQELGEISTFIKPYLNAMGIPLDLRWKLARWVKLRNARLWLKR